MRFGFSFKEADDLFRRAFVGRNPFDDDFFGGGGMRMNMMGGGMGGGFSSF